MLDFSKITAGFGFASALSILGVTLWRQRRLDYIDFGSICSSFFAGSNIPAALFLCFYVFDPDPQSVQTKLHGYEKYIAFAGLSFLFVNSVALWTLCKKAYAVTVRCEKTNTESQRFAIRSQGATD